MNFVQDRGILALGGGGGGVGFGESDEILIKIQSGNL